MSITDRRVILSWRESTRTEGFPALQCCWAHSPRWLKTPRRSAISRSPKRWLVELIMLVSGGAFRHRFTPCIVDVSPARRSWWVLGSLDPFSSTESKQAQNQMAKFWQNSYFRHVYGSRRATWSSQEVLRPSILDREGSCERGKSTRCGDFSG